MGTLKIVFSLGQWSTVPTILRWFICVWSMKAKTENYPRYWLKIDKWERYDGYLTASQHHTTVFINILRANKGFLLGCTSVFVSGIWGAFNCRIDPDLFHCYNWLKMF